MLHKHTHTPVHVVISHLHGTWSNDNASTSPSGSLSINATEWVRTDKKWHKTTSFWWDSSKVNLIRLPLGGLQIVHRLHCMAIDACCVLIGLSPRSREYKALCFCQNQQWHIVLTDSSLSLSQQQKLFIVLFAYMVTTQWGEGDPRSDCHRSIQRSCTIITWALSTDNCIDIKKNIYTCTKHNVQAMFRWRCCS